MKNLNRIQIVWWMMLCCVQLMGGGENIIHRFGEDQLMLARQVRVAGNEVLVLDEYGGMTMGDEKIKVFTLNGEFIKEYGQGGAGPGEFGEAVAFEIAVGKIFIMDSIRRQIHIFSLKNKKFIESKRIHAANPNVPFTTPSDFLVAPGERFYCNTPKFVQGQKIITRLIAASSFELKVEKAFLDCIPVYKNTKELRGMSPAELNKPENVRKSYLNKGYIATVGDKLYFTYWLLNTVYELSMDGAVLNQYTLPIESIADTVKLRKAGVYYTLDRKLNYGLISGDDSLYVMSRDTNGDTLLFKLAEGKFFEIRRIKEGLFGGDVSGSKLYAIGGDQSEIVIYNINKKRI